MGFGGISIWQLVIILIIVLMVFGTKKLRNMGGDLGTAIKGFKKSVKEEPATGNVTEDESTEELKDETATIPVTNTAEDQGKQ